MERYEGSGGVWNQDCVPFHVDKDLTGNNVLGVAIHIFESLQSIHLLKLFFLCSNWDFSSVKSNLQFTLLIQI